MDADTQRWRRWCSTDLCNCLSDPDRYLSQSDDRWLEDAAAGGEGDVRAMLLMAGWEAKAGLDSMEDGDMFAQVGGLTPVEHLVCAEVYLCWANARRGKVGEALWASYMPSQATELCEELRQRVAQWFELELRNLRKQGSSFGDSDDRHFDRCLLEAGRYLRQRADGIEWASCMPDTICSYLPSRIELCKELRRQLQHVPDRY